jgi:hypothetical protein
MAPDKTDKTLLADGMGTSDPLDGERDLFAEIGLGLGASLRAKELVLKGLLAEIYEQHLADAADEKRGRGRPNKETSVDIERAAAALAADDLWRDKTGKGCFTQQDAIDLAKQIEKILFESEHRQSRLFAKTTSESRLTTSVSKGIGILGERGRFSKK